MLDMPAENDILKFFMKKMSRNIFYRKLTENPHACKTHMLPDSVCRGDMLSLPKCVRENCGIQYAR